MQSLCNVCGVYVVCCDAHVENVCGGSMYNMDVYI